MIKATLILDCDNSYRVTDKPAEETDCSTTFVVFFTTRCSTSSPTSEQTAICNISEERIGSQKYYFS